MDIYKQFSTDKELEEEGVWHDIGEGAKVKVARWGNKKFQARMRARTKGRQREIQLKTLPESQSEAILTQCIAEAILVDWEGFEASGKKLPYSVEAAVKVMTELKDFRDIVVSLSEDAEVFRVEQAEETEKNLSSSSDSNLKSVKTN